MSDAAELIYRTMAFQYKPIEKIIKQTVPASEWRRYQKLPAARKIAICDKVAMKAGL